jgi:hypothetical protein
MEKITQYSRFRQGEWKEDRSTYVDTKKEAFSYLRGVSNALSIEHEVHTSGQTVQVYIGANVDILFKIEE